MARPIRDKGDKPFTRAPARWLSLVKQLANSGYHMKVRALATAADIIGRTDCPALHHKGKRAGMVLHIKPVANVLSVAIERQRLLGKALDEHVRDQLFWKLIR